MQKRKKNTNFIKKISQNHEFRQNTTEKKYTKMQILLKNCKKNKTCISLKDHEKMCISTENGGGEGRMQLSSKDCRDKHDFH